MCKIKSMISQIMEIISSITWTMSDVDVYYVVENQNWSIKADGLNITRNLKRHKGRVTTYARRFPQNVYVHLGSFNLLSKAANIKNAKRVIGTCFHIVDGDKRYDKLTEYDKYIDCWHTACTITRNKMVSMGINPKKIEIIPLGVDSNIFFPEIDSELRAAKRRELGIKDNQFVIGSFQKDGNGWEQGLVPKMIKGPDVFCDAIERLIKDYNIFVLLSGPARGYVKGRLDAMGVPYYHANFADPDDVADLYRLTDCYIVGSREEGGPKAILESMASGVPIVSTRVGMAPDLIKDYVNGILVDVEDVNAICQGVSKIITSEIIRTKLIANGIETAKIYALDKVVERYEKELYS